MASPDTISTATAAPIPAGWRFRFGMVLFATTILIWFVVPLVATLGATANQVARLTAAIFIANKLLLLAVIGILGRPGFLRLKGMLFGKFAKLVPDARVSPLRYNIGLVMFCLPLLSGWLEPYVDTLWPSFRPKIWQAQLLGDLMFLGSFIVLGGHFWGKVRALFVRTAIAVDTADDAAS